MAGALLLAAPSVAGAQDVELTETEVLGHVVSTNFAIFGLGFVGYFLVGYGLMFGGFSVPLIGTTHRSAMRWPAAGAGSSSTRGASPSRATRSRPRAAPP